MYKKWQTGYWIKRDKTHWFDFIINDVTDDCLVLQITDWENKDKYSFIWYDELDEYLIFNK